MIDYIYKEDFKNYYSNCQKIAWILHNKKNTLYIYQLIKDKKYFCSIEIEKEQIKDNKNDLLKDFEQNQKNIFENLNYSNEQFLDYIDPAFTDDGFYSDLLDQCWAIEGKKVGEFAREYYKYLASKKNEKTYDLSNIKDFNEAVKLTQKLIKDENIKYLFEPAFIYNGEINLKTRCDILINHGNNNFEIIEVKASVNPSLLKKPKTLPKKYFLDILYQQKTLEKLGLNIINCNFLFLSNKYISFDKTIIYDDFKSDQHITYDQIKSQIEQLEIKKSNIKPYNLKGEDLCNVFSLYNLVKVRNVYLKLFDLLNKISHEDFNCLIKKIIIHFESFDLDQKKCYKLKWNYNKEFNLNKKEIFCTHLLPWYDVNEFNVFNLKYISNIPKAINSEIAAKINNIYLKDIKDYIQIENLIAIKQEQHYYAKKQFELIKKYLNKEDIKNWIIDQKQFNNLFKEYENTPIYMYDFETANWAIPKYLNSKSYSQIPFQYSIHVLEKGWQNCDLDKFTHYEFLAKSKDDPRLELLTNLLIDLFKKGPGIYVAYYDSFEKGRLKDLAALYPKYKEIIRYIHDNTIDLFDFFKFCKNNWVIYHPLQKNSSSIKYVQPAFYPQLTYKDLKINNGQMALQAFKQYVDDDISHDLYINNCYENLLKYCERDTLAMVVLLKAIYEQSLLKE